MGKKHAKLLPEYDRLPPELNLKNGCAQMNYMGIEHNYLRLIFLNTLISFEELPTIILKSPGSTLHSLAFAS